jgi:ATP-dependent DNA ligase
MAGTHLHVTDYRKQVPGELAPNRLQWTFPTIESTNAHKKTTVWKIYVRLFEMRPTITLPNVPDDAFVAVRDEYFDGTAIAESLLGYIKVDSGLAGSPPKKSAPTIVHTGKRKNTVSPTNVWTQALRDAYGLYNKQLNKSTTSKHAIELFPPMLAQIYADQNPPPIASPTHPLYVQRKYNGVRTVTKLRCTSAPNTDVATFEVVMYSRRGRIYPGFTYIKNELLPVLMSSRRKGRTLYLDGEMYRHGAALQDISGYARREDKADDLKCDYMVYDCFIPNEDQLLYVDRKAILDGIFAESTFNYTKAVETFEVTDTAAIGALYKRFIAEGFEGAMIRLNCKYRYSYNEYHSKYLLKMKPVLDTECEITGFATGLKGKAAAALMIICRMTPGGKTFPVTPAMEINERIALAKKMVEVETNGKTHFENQWLGTRIIIHYDELSKDGVPQRARTSLERRSWD